MIKQAMEQSEQEIVFCWQGGEPTLMGLDFFEKAVSLMEKYHQGQLIGNGIQTNGILIDQKWAKFFAQNKFLVGLSLDGPEFVHNRYRRTRTNQGSFEKVIDKAKLLLDEGVEVNALSVITDFSAQFPEEIYQFFKQLGLNFMQFIPCLRPEPKAPNQPTDFSASASAFGEFLIKIFELWKRDFKNGIPTTFIRFFDSLFYHYVGLKPPECTLLKECGNYIVVEHNGEVYSCDFYVEPEWKLGNIQRERLVELLNSEKQIAFGRRKNKLSEDCQKCNWLNYCYGSCPRERLVENQSQLCLGYKMFFEYADSEFKALAGKWKERNVRGKLFEEGGLDKRAPGRNDPCPCGSGLKYKKCCGR